MWSLRNSMRAASASPLAKYEHAYNMALCNYEFAKSTDSQQGVGLYACCTYLATVTELDVNISKYYDLLYDSGNNVPNDVWGEITSLLEKLQMLIVHKRLCTI